jgi:hypothetical protein
LFIWRAFGLVFEYLILGISLVVLGTIILHALHQLHQVLIHLGVYQCWNTKLRA